MSEYRKIRTRNNSVFGQFSRNDRSVKGNFIRILAVIFLQNSVQVSNWKNVFWCCECCWWKWVSEWSRSSEGRRAFSLFCLKAPILLNIFMNHLLLFINEADVCNVADVTTLYKFGRHLELVSHKLEIDANIVIDWLKT